MVSDEVTKFFETVEGQVIWTSDSQADGMIKEDDSGVLWGINKGHKLTHN